MTREDVLDVLDQLSPLKRKRLARADVPVHFMANRIGVNLPGERYTADEQIKLAGMFQNVMTLRKGAHAFLDFVSEEGWVGAKTSLQGGFK